MKRILIIATILSVSLTAYPQFYRPFPEGSAIWTLLTENVTPIGGPPPYQYQYWSSYIIQIGDTIVGNNSYHKIYRYPYSNADLDSNFVPAYIFADTGYLGCVRQEVNEQKVFIMKKDSSSEQLLYDFTLDSIGSPFPNTIQKPDDSTFFIGYDTQTVYPATFTVDYGYSDMENNFFEPAIKEGIGAVWGGLVTPVTFFPAPGSGRQVFEQIMCLYVEDTLVFSYLGGAPIAPPDCATMLTASITALPNGSHLRVTPNPASDFIYLTYNDLPAEHQFNIAVFNTLGQPIAVASLAPASTTLSCANWQAGMYIWKVSDESGDKLAEGKVVKQ